MQFVGVSERNVLARMGIQDEVCYQKVRGDGGARAEQAARRVLIARRAMRGEGCRALKTALAGFAGSSESDSAMPRLLPSRGAPQGSRPIFWPTPGCRACSGLLTSRARPAAAAPLAPSSGGLLACWLSSSAGHGVAEEGLSGHGVCA